MKKQFFLPQTLPLTLLSFSAFFIFNFQNTFAAEGYCTYNFTKNFTYGDISYDVVELQKFLNSDSRSLVSETGPGSPGRETRFLGLATKKALERFQTINSIDTEYTGQFDYTTRQEVNKICADNKQYLSEKSAKSFTSSITKHKASTTSKVIVTGPEPVVQLSTQDINFTKNAIIKFSFKTNTPVIIPKVSDFIITGAEVYQIRKLTQVEYLIAIKPRENAYNISLQVEAEKVISLGGRTNPEASNSVTLARKPDPIPEPVIETSISDFLPSATTLFNIETDNYTYLKKAELITYMSSVNNNYRTTDSIDVETYKEEWSNPSIRLTQGVFNDQSEMIFVGSKSVNMNDYKDFSSTLSLRSLATDQEISEKYLVLNQLEYLKPIATNSTWFPDTTIKRTEIRNPNINCSRLFTFNGTQLISLFETSTLYDFKLITANSEGLKKLLIFPRKNYSYLNNTCYSPISVAPRYFPNGLFCCTKEPCNTKENLTPLIYVNNKNENQRVKVAFTVENSDDKYGTCSEIPNVPGIRRQ